jgi:hypothetical protein
MVDGFLAFDEFGDSSRILGILESEGIVMVEPSTGDLVGTWSISDAAVSPISVAHRVTARQDANESSFLWWYSSPLTSFENDSRIRQASLWRISMAYFHSSRTRYLSR